MDFLTLLELAGNSVSIRKKNLIAKFVKDLAIY